MRLFLNYFITIVTIEEEKEKETREKLKQSKTKRDILQILHKIINDIKNLYYFLISLLWLLSRQGGKIYKHVF